MSELALLTASEPAAPRRRGCLLLGVGLLVLLLGIVTLGYWWFAAQANRELREALAEADQSDPGWRLEELEARRAEVPSEKNSALRVQAANRLLPNPWPPWALGTDEDKALKSLAELPQDQLMTPVQARAVALALKSADKSLAEARHLSDLSQGRYPAALTPDYILTNLAHLRMVDVVGSLLIRDAQFEAQQVRVDAALASCRGILNTGRSIGDEPRFFSQERRLVTQAMACQQIERTLAQGQPSEPALAALQHLLEDEAAYPLFLIAERGERAGWDRLFQAMASGELSLKKSERLVAWGLLAFSGGNQNRATLLKIHNRLVEIAKLPVEEQDEHLKNHPLPLPNQVPFMTATYLLPKVQKATADLSKARGINPAALRCAIVAIAAERYRLAHGTWPTSLDALVPSSLPALPKDPYDGKPLRWRRLADGVVIYAVGPDGQDDGGKLDRTKPGAVGTDVGFRLWDVAQRRKPPQTSETKEKPDYH
jgi:hypothetical protein